MIITTGRLYLKPTIENSGRFVDAVVGKLPRGKTMMPVFVAGARCYVPWRIEDPISKWLLPFIGVITYHPKLPRMGFRMSGIYVHGTAVDERSSLEGAQERFLPSRPGRLGDPNPVQKSPVLAWVGFFFSLAFISYMIYTTEHEKRND